MAGAPQEKVRKDQQFIASMPALWEVATGWYFGQPCFLNKVQEDGVQHLKITRQTGRGSLPIFDVVPEKGEFAHHSFGETEASTRLEGVRRIATDENGRVHIDTQRTKIVFDKGGIVLVKEEPDKSNRGKTGVLSYDGKKASYKGPNQTLVCDTADVRRREGVWSVGALMGSAHEARARIDEKGVWRIARIIDINNDNPLIESTLIYDRDEAKLSIQDGGMRYQVDDVVFTGGKLDGTLRFHVEGVIPADFSYGLDGLSEITLASENYKARYAADKQELSYKSGGINLTLGSINGVTHLDNGWRFTALDGTTMTIDNRGLETFMLQRENPTAEAQNSFFYTRDGQAIHIIHEGINISVNALSSWVKTASGWEVRANTPQKNAFLVVDNDGQPVRLMLTGLKNGAVHHQAQYAAEKNTFMYHPKGKDSLVIADVAVIDIKEDTYYVTTQSGEEKVRYTFGEEGLEDVRTSTWVYRAGEGVHIFVGDQNTNLIDSLVLQRHTDGVFVFAKNADNVQQAYSVGNNGIYEVAFKRGGDESASLVYEQQGRKITYGRNNHPTVELVGVDAASVDDHGMSVMLVSDMAETVVDLDIDGIVSLTVDEKTRDVVFDYDRIARSAMFSLGGARPIIIDDVVPLQRSEARISFEGQLHGRRVIMDIDNVTKRPRFVFPYKVHDGKREKTERIIIRELVGVHDDGTHLRVLFIEDNQPKEMFFNADGMPSHPVFPDGEEGTGEIEIFDQDFVRAYRNKALPLAKGIAVDDRFANSYKLFSE